MAESSMRAARHHRPAGARRRSWRRRSLRRRSPLDRSVVVAAAQSGAGQGRAEIRRRFEADGQCAARGPRAVLPDRPADPRALRPRHRARSIRSPTRPRARSLAIVAVGGYGRGELAPYSDIDLLFLLPYKQTPHTEQVVEYLLYLLWDLGLKVGQATRSVDGMPALRQGRSDDPHGAARSALHLGRAGAVRRAEAALRYARSCSGTAAQFVEAKLAERDARHQRVGDSRYQLEPNVKEGKGGLRDLHTLFWIAKYIYRIDDVGKLVELGVLSAEESQRFERAQTFLWTVRCHLHYLAGRAEERLTFDLQTEIGRRMGYTDHAGSARRRALHEALFPGRQGCRRSDPHLLRASSKPTRSTSAGCPGCAGAAGRRALEGFVVDGERLTIPSEDFFKKDPVALLRLFHVAQQHDLDIHPRALRAVTPIAAPGRRKLREDPEANRLFLEILTSRKDPETALRRMNEAGVFGRFIPDFGRVVAQMQYDMYHVYTVDEHTLFAIGILHKIESGQLKEEHAARHPDACRRSCRAARSISRCCCTTSPRAAAAIIRCSASRSR